MRDGGRRHVGLARMMAFACKYPRCARINQEKVTPILDNFFTTCPDF
jgi:hypothetical protein